MSINRKRFSFFTAAVCGEIILAALFCAAQSLEVSVKISPDSPKIAQISGKFLKQSNKNWFFLKAIANADNLSARISNFELFDDQNRAVIVRKLADGEYLADAVTVNFQYQINLYVLPNALTRAHVSWISDERQGILMLDDLLPQFAAGNEKIPAKIKFALPDDWQIISTEKKIGENVFQTENIVKAVFVVGKNWREINAGNVHLIAAGEWQYSDVEAAQMAKDIAENHQKLFGDKSFEKSNVVLVRLPKDVKFGRWEAETRGRTTTIASADKAFKAQSIQLLHEQLRHELFHLWIPNGLNLTGNYDWFYEGFAVYQALRTGLQMNQIRFEDFLATLSEAYNLDSFQTNKVSLVESSKNRWNGANPQVYARGMIVAFLCDAAILKQSDGKRSVENLLREIYQKHRRPNIAADGNTAILNVLRRDQSLAPIVEKYIEGAEKIDWESDLENFGIEAAAENSFVRLRVKAKLNGRQKDLLNELGYNNWRKISQKSK